MAFFYVHYVLIYQTVTSLTYVFVPLDFRPHRLRAGAFRLMVGGNTRRPDVERPRKTYLFNRGPNRITLTSERLAPLRKRSKCYVAKIAYGHHVLRDGNPHHLDVARFAV